MASPKHKNPISALSALSRGVPVAAATLKEIGISRFLAAYYVRSGWLVRLGRGVFAFPNDKLDADATIKFLSTHVPGLHVGGKTALAQRGVRHNVGPRERLIFWGDTVTKLPPWFTARFPSRYVSRQLFDRALPKEFGIQPIPEKPNGPPVSVPERALLELLVEVGVDQGLEEARNIMEGLRSVRIDVLETLLKHCPRVKVVRLCLNLAEELNLPWASEIRKLVGTRGHGRWFGKMADGTTLILKP